MVIIGNSKYRQKEYRSLLVTCLLFSLLIILGVMLPIFSWVVFFLSILYIVLTRDAEKKFIFTMYLFPFASAFKFRYDAASFSTYLIIVLLLSMIIQARKLDRRFSVLFVFFTLMCAVGLSNGYGYVVKQICIPLFLYFMLQPNGVKDKYAFARFYILSVIIVSVLGYFKEYIPNLNLYLSDKSLKIDSGVYAIRFSGFWGDPNYFAVNILLALSLVVVLHSKNKARPLLCYLSYVLLTVFGALTFSKSFLVVFIALIVFAIVMFVFDKKYFAAVFLLLIALSGYLLVSFGYTDIFRTIINRFTADRTLAEITTSRSVYWLEYTNYFNKHFHVWLIGRGFNSPLLYGVAPHNTYIDFIYNFGLIGSLIWFKTSFYQLRCRSRSKEYIDYLPLLVILMAYFGLSELKYFDLMFQVSLALVFFTSESKATELSKGKCT